MIYFRTACFLRSVVYNDSSLKPTDYNERPFILFWEVTRACALACRHCRAEAQKKPAPDELTHAEAMKLADQITQLHPQMLVLTGGDPVMREDLLDIVRRTAGSGLRVALSPAATPLLLRTNWEELRTAGVSSLSLSLDGATAETHDRFRGVPHTFDRTLEAARRAKEAGLMLQVNTTLSRSTIRELPLFETLIQRILPDVWSLFVLVPTGRATMEELPTAEQLETVWQRVLELRKGNLPFVIKTTEGHHFRRALLQAATEGKASAPRHLIPTRDGKGVFFISHTGEMQPSGFLQISLGNVRHEDLIKTYREHPIMQKLRDDDALGGKCGRCEFRHVCGGSRARAYEMTGDMFAAEPLCCYTPIAMRTPSS